MKSCGLTPHARVFRWQHDQTFYPQKLADHLALDKHFTVCFEKHDILPLRLALGTLYVLDNSLPEMTELRQRDLVMRDRTKSTWIGEKDMVMVGLWVANRAAMWIGAQHSRPLLKFVEELDTYVYVL